MKLFVNLSLLLLFTVPSLAQYTSVYESMKTSPVTNIKTSSYYLSQLEKTKELKGFEIIKKLGNHYYIIKPTDSSLLANSNIKLYTLPKDWKLSPTLKKLYATTNHKNKIVKVSMQIVDHRKNTTTSYHKIDYSRNNNIIAEVTVHQLEDLMQDENILFISLYKTPTTEALVSSSNFSVNGITSATIMYPNINGENSTISIKELLFDVSDIDYFTRVRLNGNEAESADQHATAMATLVGGSGNSGPTGKGVAQQSTLSSSSFLQLFPDDTEQFITNDIYIQNHSYGVSVENFYGNEAAAYDEQIFTAPDLVHVFSVGNSGLENAQDGAYAGLDNFATLTGNFKQAKNILTVGATDALDIVDERSSKGPSFDGRVKPDFVAYAPGGTSDAAALVSGTVALIQDFYFKNNNNMPLFPLVKSILIAGSEDVGPQHIDFSSGYGKLNALNSLVILDDNTFEEGFVSEGETITHSVIVSENTNSLKVALSWLDNASSPGSNQLLNNNLNLSLLAPDGTIYNPWVLNSMASTAALNEIAIRGVDVLNTSELITLENPVPGEYIIRIVSDSQNTNQVPYAVSYYMEESGIFEWQYPLENESVSNATFPVLRWKNTTDLTNGNLSYRLNSGPWILISENINLADEKFLWELPIINGNVELRISSGTESYISKSFQISDEPQLNVQFNCDDSVGLTWNVIPNATGYEVKSLINNTFETIATVTEPNFINSTNENSSEYFNVTPIFGSNTGVASNTLNINNTGVSCYFRGFFAFLADANDILINLELSTAINIAQIQFVKSIGSEQIVINTLSPPFNDLSISIRDILLLSGNNTYFAKIILEDGTIIETNLVDLFIPEDEELILYPNPVQNGFSLNFISKGVTFQIIDFSGKVIIEDNVLAIEDFIGINLSQGVYVFQILDVNKKPLSAKRFIVR